MAEYKVVTIGKNVNEDLNRWCQYGYELVAVNDNYIFLRLMK